MIDGIVARRVTPHGVETTDIVLHDADIRFLVIGRRHMSAIIHNALWPKGMHFMPERVYARTADGVFLTRFKSLTQAERLLRERGRWLRVSQSILVGAAHIRWIELYATKRKLVGFETKDGQGVGEAVEIGPDYLKSVRSRLACTSRVRRSSKRSIKKQSAKRSRRTPARRTLEEGTDEGPRKGRKSTSH